MSKQTMTFEEIEGCYPDGASVNEYGEIIVSAQWLYDFARKVEESIKQHDAEPVAWMKSDHLSKFQHHACGSQSMLARCSDHKLQSDYVPLYAAPKPE